MFAKLLIGPLLLGAAQLVFSLGHPKIIEQPKAPIQSAGPLWAARCASSADAEKPAPPVRIHGNTYLVGTCGVSSILIVGDQGDILIDAGTGQDSDFIAANIRSLGFRPEDIRFILHGEDVPDHVAGIATMQQMSGATLVASAAAAKLFEGGSANSEDPQFGMGGRVQRASVGRLIGDNQELRLGNLMLTAMTTPGRTAGGLSWRWVSCDGGVCRTIVYADSLSPVSGPDYRFSDHPAFLAAYRESIAKIAASPCEILLTTEPRDSDMPQRLALGEPLLDVNACKVYANRLLGKLDERLAKEHGR